MEGFNGESGPPREAPKEWGIVQGVDLPDSVPFDRRYLLEKDEEFMEGREFTVEVHQVIEGGLIQDGKYKVRILEGVKLVDPQTDQFTWRSVWEEFLREHQEKDKEERGNPCEIAPYVEDEF